MRRRFGTRDVLRSLDVTVHAGERAAVCGPNGCGKTTFLRCVAGTLAPTGGEIHVAGHRAGTLGARAAVGVSLSQERSFHGRLTGHAQLLVFARLRDHARAQVTALEEELELATIADHRVDRCSAGMVQQLAFARALLGQPSLLVLDEPTRSMDGSAVGRFWAALDRRPHLAVLMATHHEEDVVRCGRRVALPS